jgi:hypothetical protein
VDKEELFGHIDIKVGSELCDVAYKVITVHPEWNFIFLVRKVKALVWFWIIDETYGLILELSV